MTKGLKFIAVITLISLISAIFVGCSMASTYKRIKSNPDIKDFEVYDTGNSMDFNVMLNENSNLDSQDANDLAKELANAIKTKYKNKAINLRVTKNNQVLGSYSLDK